MLRILIIDDHVIIRRGVKQIILEAYPSAIIEEACDAEDAMVKMLDGKFSIIICDLSMPGRSGLDVVQYAMQHIPKTPVLILSIHPEEQYAIRTLKAGAAGYLSKDVATEELVQAMQRVLQGRKYISPSIVEKMALELKYDQDKPIHDLLSDREFHVLQLLGTGKIISEIAEELSLSLTTVSTYRARVMMKMGMKNNAELMKYALENKLV